MSTALSSVMFAKKQNEVHQHALLVCTDKFVASGRAIYNSMSLVESCEGRRTSYSFLVGCAYDVYQEVKLGHCAGHWGEYVPLL